MFSENKKNPETPLTNCPRFMRKLPVISQKVAQKNQNLAFPVTNVALFFFFGMKQKYPNCTRKVRFLSIFVEFCGVRSFLNNFVLN